MNYKEIKGDLIELAINGEFDVITHGCNCFNNMGAGIAVSFKNEFAADRFILERHKYKGDVNKLGQIDYEYLHLNEWFGNNIDKELIVINSYTQYYFGKRKPLFGKQNLDYNAFRMCMRKINHQFKGKHIGLPLIGCGLAKGNWDKVKSIIQSELIDMNVTIVHYKK